MASPPPFCLDSCSQGQDQGKTCGHAAYTQPTPTQKPHRGQLSPCYAGGYDYQSSPICEL